MQKDNELLIITVNINKYTIHIKQSLLTKDQIYDTFEEQLLNIIEEKK